MFFFTILHIVYIKHYVIKFVSDLRQVGGFLRVLTVSFTKEADHHDIAEILLKVALNTISLPLTLYKKGTIFFHSRTH